MSLQLQQLMETLNAIEPHYIRCVKPNNLLEPEVFENANIMRQLRCGVSIFDILVYAASYNFTRLVIILLFLYGVLEAIRISCLATLLTDPFLNS